jgi:hypothetical protein
MTADTGRSVLAQLTAGVPLPLPALPSVVLQVIVSGIVTAWKRIPQDQVIAADEAALNAMLEIQLNGLLRSGGRLGALVAVVVRGKETVSFDGRHLEKRPDLSLVLTDNAYARDFPLVAECKLIDRRAKKAVDLYCKNGVSRFVGGEYGWARPEGIMLAYVRDGSTIATVLSPYLARCSESVIDPFCTVVLPKPVGAEADQGDSEHFRPFRYPERFPASDPGNIRLRHLWLSSAEADGAKLS